MWKTLDTAVRVFFIISFLPRIIPHKGENATYITRNKTTSDKQSECSKMPYLWDFQAIKKSSDKHR